MQLIIVESPTKARTLARFLDGKYQIQATMGHIRDLPRSTLGIDVEHDFTPSYLIPKDKHKRVKALIEQASKAEKIILATDPDREGEAIAWHMVKLLANNSQPSAVRKKKRKAESGEPVSPSRYAEYRRASGPRADNFQRIVFHEITKSAIIEALSNPRSIDMQLVDSQQARRVLDRLVGYKLSPLLWQKLSRRWLSAGRVQSVAVRLIVEREREIAKFSRAEYWSLVANFKGVKFTNEEILTAKLTSYNGQPYELTESFDLFDGKYTVTKTNVGSKQAAKDIINSLADPYQISAVDKKEIKRYPPPPYTTSTLQQDAGRKLYFSAKRTMQLAQKLYEEGIITYHRTDSVNLAAKFVDEARAFIQNKYGPDFLPETPRLFQTKSKVAQEAHEAVRPTDVTRELTDIKSLEELNRDHIRLYDIIWKRAASSQAKEAVFDSTSVTVTSSNGYTFVARGSVVKFEGYLAITGRDNGDVVIPDMAVGQNVSLISTYPEQHFTNPPPRYTEAGLINTLEEKDIGRPSTYAPIISTIQERQYVTKEEKKLLPTELGNSVTDFLVQYFPGIMELPFTAQMEAKLDEIANGTVRWVPVISEFWGPFSLNLEETYKQAQKVKIPVEELHESCPECGSPLVLRIGRYGKFIACPTFPKCKYTKQFSEKIDMKCPKCGGDIVVKKSRRGKTFYGCSNYPNCIFAAWKKEDIK